MTIVILADIFFLAVGTIAAPAALIHAFRVERRIPAGAARWSAHGRESALPKPDDGLDFHVFLTSYLVAFATGAATMGLLGDFVVMEVATRSLMACFTAVCVRYLATEVGTRPRPSWMRSDRSAWGLAALLGAVAGAASA